MMVIVMSACLHSWMGNLSIDLMFMTMSHGRIGQLKMEITEVKAKHYQDTLLLAL